MTTINNYIEKELIEKFEFHNYNHALEIIAQSYPTEWNEIKDCLNRLEITTDELCEPGGNETQIPKKFDDILYPYGWKEIKITGDLHIKFYPHQANQRGGFSTTPFDERVIEGYIDGHNIDFVKNEIAFDLEWNSKDQTFDRDLLAMRTYYDCNLISVGIIVTRSEELNEIFKNLYDKAPNGNTDQTIMRKYGPSTTWMGKLIPRLDSRRNGGCPILAIGIRKKCIIDWTEG